MDGAATAAGGAAATGLASVMELAVVKLEDVSTIGCIDRDTDDEMGVTIDALVTAPVAAGELTMSKAPVVGDWVLMEPSSSDSFFPHVAICDRPVGGNGA